VLLTNLENLKNLKQSVKIPKKNLGDQAVWTFLNNDLKLSSLTNGVFGGGGGGGGGGGILKGKN